MLCSQLYGKEGFFIADIDITAAVGPTAQRCESVQGIYIGEWIRWLLGQPKGAINSRYRLGLFDCSPCGYLLNRSTRKEEAEL
jgi:hypothetical protein